MTPNLNFDPSGIDVEDTFAPVPTGWYLCVIVDTVEKVSRAGHAYLKFEMECIEGPHKGRRFWDNLNVNHPTPITRTIAQKTIARIMKAVGLPQARATEDLHMKPLMVKVKLITEEENPEYGPKNEVKGYKPVGSATAQPEVAPASSTQDAAPAAAVDSTPPPQAAPATAEATQGEKPPWAN